MPISPPLRTTACCLLCGVSLLGLSPTAEAASVAFSAGSALRPAEEIVPGREYSLASGTTQIRLDTGQLVSFVGASRFAIDADGTIELREGTATVLSQRGTPITVRMPDGVSGSVSGPHASASFTADASGSHGNVIQGHLALAGPDGDRSFDGGNFWRANGAGDVHQTQSNGATEVADTAVVPVKQAGIAGAAQNGEPIALALSLAAAGAAGDIVGAAQRVEAFNGNPTLDTFPRGDFSTLAAYSAAAARAYGGASFPGAGPDIVRAYLEYLAGGGTRAVFLSTYAQLLVNYLDLLRSGALPSGFQGATQAQLSAYIAFIGRTSGFGALNDTNRALLDTYLAFLSTGGTPDGFAPRLGSVTTAYLDFLRGGGDPAAFEDVSQSVLQQYLAIVGSGGIRSLLNPQNRAFLDAYLASLKATGDGLAFSRTAATSLADFVAFLNAGGLPSDYAALDAATLRAYLETLQATGLFDRVLGAQAAFLSAYLAYLQGGGTPDQFAQLPINVLTGNAAALAAYLDYLQSGGIPSGYTALTQAQVVGYLQALRDAGLFDRLLGANASFYADYLAYLDTGADPDLYAGLPSVDLNAYAQAIGSFVAYLRAGHLPSGYTALSAAQIRAYLNALAISGQLSRLPGQDASLLSDYLAYLQTGGAPDNFSGLPIVTYQNYAAALNAYYAYLTGGGLPSNYDRLTQAQVQAYLEALKNAGQLSALLGANGGFLADYLAYLQGGGAPDSYANLPILTYRNYAAALADFYAFLAAGGLPSAYTKLTAAQIRAYLEALQNAGQLSALLGANFGFLSDYLAYLQGGGAPDQFASLPVHMGGGGTPVDTGGATGLLATYQGGFTATTGLNVYSASPETSGWSSNQSGAIGSDGAWSGSGNTVPLTATATDVAGDERAVIGRFHDGTFRIGQTTVTYAADNGLAYVVMAPIVGSLPTSGSIDYQLLAATRPVYGDGHTAPGTFTANLTVGFGSALTYGIDGKITMPDATYAFASPGRSQGQLATAQVGNNPNFFVIRPTLTGSGPACTTNNCQLNLYGGFGGANPEERLGFGYTTIGSGGVSTRINGAAIFANAASSTPAPTPTPTPSPAPAAPSGTGLRFMTAGATTGDLPTLESLAGVDLTAQADATVQAYSSGNGSYTLGTAGNVDSGTAAGVIGWTRWAGGIASGSSGTADAAYAANGGLHMIWGTPATNIPTSGSAQFRMIGATRPTGADGASAPGSVDSAQLGVNFASRKVGLDASITYAGSNFTIATDGGATNPSVAYGAATGVFSAAANAGSRESLVYGFLAGPGASHAGVVYRAVDPTGGAQIVTGAIAFGR